LTVLVAAGAAQAADTLVGCDTRLPVTEHRAAGAVLQPPRGVPVPVVCVVSTGYASSESTIGVTPRGTIVYSPAGSENSMARSSDGGAHWSLTYPFDEQYTALWNTDDPYLWVDRRTGRIFWSHATGPTRTAPVLVSNSPLPSGIPTAIAAASGFQVYSSPDEGVSWHTADYSTAPTGDWDKLFTGPPAPSAPHPSGYPDVVYFCANSPTEALGPGRLCYRSLDGGITFEPAGYVFPSAQQPAGDCQALLADNGAVGPDGTVFQPVTCADGSYVAVSTDDGSTYQWRPVVGAPPASGIAGVSTGVGGLQIAVDDAGELYAMWSTGRRVMVVRSPDGGRTWSPPLDVTAPGLAQVALPALAAGPAGDLGVAYYGSSDPKAIRLTAYLTTTATGTDHAPVFTSAALNPPGQPIFQPSGVAGGLTPRADYIGTTFDNHGTLWVGAVRQIGQPDAKGNVATTGLVGHLTTPPATGPPEAAPRAGCPAPPGKLSDRTLGPIALGRTRARVRRGLRRSDDHRAPYTDVFCFTPIGIRVGFPPPAATKRLSAKARRATAGRVVLILTANRHYTLRRIRPGIRVASAKRTLRLERPIHTGRNIWYLTRLKRVTGVLKTNHGIVREIGIADPRLTTPRRLAMRLLASF
jgi:hypothetical protein